MSLAPGATEMLFAAGAGEQVIATVEYSDEPPAARRIPRIGDVAAVDLERLVALQPDVVIAWPAGSNPAQRAKIARLQHRDLRTAGGAAGGPRGLSTPPRRARGHRRGRRARGARHRRAARRRSTRATLRRGRRARPSVLLQVWNRPIYTVGGRHLMSDALEICGARNLFADLPEAGPVVDTEAVIARDPDIIVAAAPPGEGAAWLADWRRFGESEGGARASAWWCSRTRRLSRLGPSVIDATEGLCQTHRGAQSRKLLNCSGTSSFAPRSSAIAACRSSRFLPTMRTLSPCRLACTLSVEVLDQPGDLPAAVLIDAVPQQHFLVRGGEVRLRLFHLQAHQVDAALGEAQLEDLQHLLELKVHLRVQRDRELLRARSVRRCP